MEGVVAKRCLRNSSDSNNYNYDRGYSRKGSIKSLYSKGLVDYKKVSSNEDYSKKGLQYRLYKIKLKLWIQSINAMCLIITIVILNMLNVSAINNNKYIKMVKNEYNKNYPLKEIKNNGIKLSKKLYAGIAGIVPDKIENKAVEIFNSAKGKALSVFNKQEKNNNNNVKIYTEENKQEIQEQSKESIGVSIEEIPPAQVESSSSVVEKDIHVKYVKDNNISFVRPAEGKITSLFGDREVIFPDVDPYHTGVDIANSKGVKVVSSIDGTITKVANNKYNGNFIEITNQGVITKYAHLDSVSVEMGKSIKAGDEIGKMGETGYATGPHLHFEVVVNGTKIDPKKVVEL